MRNAALTNSVSALAKGIISAAEHFRDDGGKLTEITEAMSVPLIVCNGDCTYRWVSEAYARFLGMDADQMKGRTFVDVIGTEAVETIRPFFERALAGEYVDYEGRVFYKGVGWRWVHAVYSPLFGRDGEGDGWIALILDIDQDRRAEESFKERERRFRRLADSAPVLMWMGNVEGQTTFVNAAFVAFAGASESYICKHWEDLIHPEDRAEYVAAFRETLASREDWQRIVRLRRYDAVYRWFEVVGVPRYERQRFAGYTGCCFDITTIKQSESDALRANNQKDEFLAVLGHELRNPMGAISNAVAILEGIGISDPYGKRAVEIARRQVDQLARLMDDLSEVGRLVAGKIKLACEPIDLGEAASRVLQAFQTSGKLRSRALDVLIEPAWVEADLSRLEQVIGNLLDNALKFTPEQGRIELRTGICDDRAILRVSDSGIGISKDFQPRLFEPFSQAQSVFSGESSGLGLGLALVKRLVELNRGHVAVASEGLGRGCTFTVSLPQITAPISTRPSKAALTAAARRRVVVIEDNDDNRESTQKLLQVAGHEVETARDGPEGVDLAIKFSPQVALVDLALPTWDGYEVAKRLRDKFGKAIRVVALSGFARDEDKAAANAAGFDDFLVKPVSPERLREVLRLAL